jgi:hypothetical protein
MQEVCGKLPMQTHVLTQRLDCQIVKRLFSSGIISVRVCSYEFSKDWSYNVVPSERSIPKKSNVALKFLCIVMLSNVRCENRLHSTELVRQFHK